MADILTDGQHVGECRWASLAGVRTPLRLGNARLNIIRACIREPVGRRPVEDDECAYCIQLAARPADALATLTFLGAAGTVTGSQTPGARSLQGPVRLRTLSGDERAALRNWESSSSRLVPVSPCGNRRF